VNYVATAIAVATAAAIACAQPSHPAAEELQNAGLPAQKLAPEDLLHVSVYDAPELTGPVRVGDDGTIRLPMLPAPIEVSGLLPREVEHAIAAALKKGGVLVDPVVAVSVIEYRSHPINVIGAVRTPLTFQAYGRVTLLDALTRAGGVTETAGDYIVVSESVADGDNPGTALPMRRIALKRLLDGTNPDANLVLRGGEEIRIPEAAKIYVGGNVRRPGAFVVQDGTRPSVLKMLALSEGVTRYAQKTAYIYRGDAGSRGKKEIPVEISRILQRKAPDVPLEPDDVLYIPENSRSHGWSVALNTLLIVGGAGLGSAAVYTLTR